MQVKTTLLAASLLGLLTFAACKSLGTPEDQTEAGSLWAKMSDYRSWAHFEGHEGIQRSKSKMHGKFVRTFVNGTGATNPSAPGYGTIIVKENFSKDDAETLMSMTVMQRIEGYDPENEDWFWARFTPGGELTHAGKVGMCSDCHFDAGGDDFVFLND
jgi:cytochrome P460